MKYQSTALEKRKLTAEKNQASSTVKAMAYT